MKLGILAVLIFLAISALGQSDTVFKQRIERVLNEYSNNFKGFIGKEKLSGVPKRLFVQPGLQDGIDEIHIWGDTLFIYSSVIKEQGDSSATRSNIAKLDYLLQCALGPQFSREVGDLSFSENNEVPLTFKSGNVEVHVSVGKFKDKYITLLVFSGLAKKNDR